MIAELLAYIERLFPSIDPYTADNARRALRQFEETCTCNAMTLSSVPDDLRQGDIFENVRFFLADDDGELNLYKARCMLLTNTCDCERNDNLEFAAIWPLSKIFPVKEKADDLKRNKNYQYLYIPDMRLEDDIIDFGSIVSLPREYFLEQLGCMETSKVVSLSWVGYYVFLAKLTVFFMRPEDQSVNKLRDADI